MTLWRLTLSDFQIRPVNSDDGDWVAGFIAERWGAEFIAAHGQVYYCSQTRGLPQFALGDLHDNSFREIWESERRKNINQSIDITKCQPICRCHPINKALWTIRHPDPGVNFV